MKAKEIDGTVYSHPIGLHGHGAGPLIGLWDYQDGVPGRGDAKVIPSMWFSIELQATTPVPEWNKQPVRMAQEEDAIVGADGKIRWALRRQDTLFLIRPKGVVWSRETVVEHLEVPVAPDHHVDRLVPRWTSCFAPRAGIRRSRPLEIGGNDLRRWLLHSSARTRSSPETPTFVCLSRDFGPRIARF